MGLNRRELLAGLGAVGLSACARPAPAPRVLTGQLQGHEQAARGHRLREPFAPGNAPGESAQVVIVGGGIAGLTAAWRLGRAGVRDVVVLELGDRPGGTAAQGDGPLGPHPLGAHYITLPNPAARHVRTMLHEFGVIRDFVGGRPRYDGAALCVSPQERLFQTGAWGEGLWPGAGASAEDNRQRADFEAHCAGWRSRRGADGLRAFEIPVELSSKDPEIRALADVSFEDYLKDIGWDSERLRWVLRYGCRDDYGTELADTSAWAGLHYHCSRDPDPAEPDLGTHVLTWPGGNGWLVEQLLARSPARFVPQALVRAVEARPGGVTAWYELGGSLRRLDAPWAVLATPAAVSDRLVGRSGPEPRPAASPWRVASLFCDRLPEALGLPWAWDSVIYGSDSLGYVTNSHQRAGYGGPAVLTWYEPLSEGAPRERARELLGATWEAEAERVLADVGRAHPGIRSVLSRLDVMHWGHGTVRPAPGLHRVGALDGLAAMRPGLSFAHTDLSGLSLFEEASWHGVRAAEEAMAALGVAGETLL